MASCEHCGTEFDPRTEDSRYCCRGCQFVAELISENGFEQFYDLKQGLAVAPVRSRPFEEHDFSWLPERVATAEERARARHEQARMDCALEGISCVGCVWLVEKLFLRHPGAVRASAHPSSGRLHLEWLPGECRIEPFFRELCQFGYVAAPASVIRGDAERRRLAARLGLCGAFALNTMAFSLPVYLDMPRDFEFAPLFRLITFLTATLSMLVGAGYFIDRAWRTLRAGAMHIDLPIALGLIVAYLGSIVGWALDHERLLYFDFVATFVFLMLGGRFLQTAAVDKNRRRLVRQQPVPEAVEVVAKEPGTPAAAVARDAISPGLRFVPAAGQALPVSGLLAEGEADFSLEWIHGEADPVRFRAGARLPAGAILLSRAPVVVEALERWEESLLAKLVAPPGEERRPPGLDRLLRVYLAIVLVIGVLTFLGWIFLAKDWVRGLQAMISVFVVSCPCALGVAIPLADDLAASAMERLGVFVRNATLWPRLTRVRRVVFDKTGTLTLERPLLENPADVAALDDAAAAALAVMTRGSLHPVSRALLEALGRRGQKLLATHDLADAAAAVPAEFPGLGVAVEMSDGWWSLGRAGWDGVSAAAAQAGEAGSELRHEGRVVARFAFREALRPGALETLKQLRGRGLAVHILSGDHPEKVAQLASRLGLSGEAALGGLSPEEKAGHVRRLDRHDTLYLGDGANDSLAFDAALVTGTPVVDRSLLESKADFYTLGSGLAFLPGLLRAAFARSRGVRSAFAFALLYNLTTVAFSAAGHMHPLLAAILMPLSSIVSILIVVAGFRRGSGTRDVSSHPQPA